ncbi:microsomal glutathione S-transferase 1 [Patella vulgata]|uniref:microsomal glutathione S-transferase 1 n=1 Tax=Patella vulgata TaxID=6465 RepID=UPI00217FA3CB|nr:microsomal glutathione S-transferase 1 [Patella vulgata]
MAVETVLSLDNPVFTSFLFYSTLVILKMMSMSLYTAFHRLTKKVFANEEDCRSAAKPGKKLQPVLNHADVERVRRCHLNDLENITAFVLIGLLYTLTGPDVQMALLHFRIFAGCRIAHTFFYLFAIPQPTRALAFMGGFIVTISMAVNIFKVATF